MLWPIDSCQNRVSADQYHITVWQAQVSTHFVCVYFCKLSADKLLIFKWSQAQVQVFKMHGENVVLMSRSINILIDSGGENSASFYRREGSCFWLFSPWSLIGHALRPIFMLWLLKIWQVSSRGKFMHYLETGLVIAEADSFVSSYSCTKWKTAAIKILLLFMAGLFIGFSVEKCTAFPSHRKSVFWWHRFQNEPLPNLAGCVGGLKSLRRFWPYLMAFRSCISTGKPE